MYKAGSSQRKTEERATKRALKQGKSETILPSYRGSYTN